MKTIRHPFLCLVITSASIAVILLLLTFHSLTKITAEQAAASNLSISARGDQRLPTGAASFTNPRMAQMTMKETRSLGLDLSTLKNVQGEVFSAQQCVETASKYGITKDEARILLTWWRGRAYVGADYENKAI